MIRALKDSAARWRLHFAASKSVPTERDAPGARTHVSQAATPRWRSWLSRIDPVVLGILGIVVVGLVLRTYGLNWDGNNHLHPDEREIVFRAICLNFPGQLRDLSCPAAASGPGWFFSTDSPLNPHFFAYGSFPLYLLAFVANALNWLTSVTHGHLFPVTTGAWTDFDHFTLVGRTLSALFDAGSVLVAGLLARRLAGPIAGLLAAAFVAFIPFDIQVSHFYAVDTVMLFFVLLALLCAVGLAQALTTRHATAWAIAAGAATGLAIATKVSAAPLALPVLIAVALLWRRAGAQQALTAALWAISTGLIAFVVTSPYAFIDNVTFKKQVTEQTMLSQGQLDYPYVRQFAGTTPYLYPLQQMLRYNMGLPLALVGIVGLLWAASRLWRSLDDDWLIIVSWVAVYFGIVGNAYMKFGRYMLPVYAPLCVLAAGCLVAAWRAASHLTSGGDDGLIARLRRGLARVGTKWWRWALVGLTVIVLGYTALSALAIDNLYSEPVTRVRASEWLYDHVTPGKTVTYEEWDDPLPIMAPPARVENGVPVTAAGNPIVPSEYQQVGLGLYDDDTVDKADKLAGQLASADVVVISSQRLLKSIPKLPDRYPMTTRYYQLLFAGKLGFTLTKTFSEQPHFLGYTLDDTGADESFSVYDHPPVWLFTKTGNGLSADEIKTLLTKDLALPAEPSGRPGSMKSLLLTPDQEAANQATLPLGVQFPAGSLANAVAPLWWLLAVELLGLAVFPLAFFAFPGLRDRGWGVSKTLGIILLAWLIWMPASLKILPFDQWVVALAFLLLAVLGAGLAWWRRSDLLAFFTSHWRLVAMGEAAFVAAYVFFLWIRSLDPDLWHIYRGGEKPMELAYLDGILRSRTMPPADPWFAGGVINYYYYGQFIIATLIKLTGIVPTTAFNLAVALLFALVFAAAFSVGAGLTGRVWVGLAAGVGLVVLGNLEGVWQLAGQWQAFLHHQPIPTYDYWASSRVIPCLGQRNTSVPCYDTTINEFPYWSFLYADLHAHLIALPVVVTIIAGCASLVASAREQARAWRPALLTLAVLALALGTVYAANTWDVPAYAVLIVLALLIRLMPLDEGPAGWAITNAVWPWVRLRNLLAAALAVIGGAYLLFFPFSANYQSFVSGIGTTPTNTAPYQFIAIFGLWLFLLVSFFALEAYDALSAVWGGEPGFVWRLAIVGAGLFVLVVSLVSLKAFFFVILAVGVSLALLRRMTARKLFTYAVLLLGVIIALGVELVYVRDFLDNSPYERMNTVFKFYYEVWTLFALGGVLALAWILPRLRPALGRARESAGMPLRPALRFVWTACLVLLVAGSTIFLVQGTAVRVADPQVWAEVQPPPGGIQPQGLSLDGMAYMRGWYPSDYNAITWMNQHIGGMPTIVEANLGMYTWSGRVSIYTGLPDVVQTGHENEQRYGSAGQPYGDQIGPRVEALNSFWSTTSLDDASQFLRTYHVRYVYLGQLERTCFQMINSVCQPMPAGALDKFITLQKVGVLRPVYDTGDVVIYQVVAP